MAEPAQTASLCAALTRRAGFADFGELIGAAARRRAGAVALDDGRRSLSYAALDERANRAAHMLLSAGIRRGDRFGVLAENRIEYVELAIAAARVGAVLCAMNWRFAPAEIEHCIRLTGPSLLFVSARHASLLEGLQLGDVGIVDFGADYEALLDAAAATAPPPVAEPEDGYLILYTSGTTGAPKAALISHRAELARFALSQIDADLRPGDAFVAWAPMFHMVSLEHLLHVLALGGTVYVVDGADIERIVDLAIKVPQWWLVLLPGMVDRAVETMHRAGTRPAPIKVVGALADLVSPSLVGATSRAFNAPYWNTFGSTEAGILPFAGTRFAIGEVPTDLAKAPNSLHLYRLVDAEGRDVRDGEPGEAVLRGQTLFSGYWNAAETNAQDFRDGWFHTGDVFAATDGGRYRYVDRVKYLIKTGAENVYPAEIERVLLADPRVVEAVVVRRPDERWGEVPVAIVCCNNQGTTEAELMELCRGKLARYKWPKAVHFVTNPDEFPRSTSGKIQRQALEKRVR
ncbi:MAG TPA: AMP-binding protein [Candidatus Sulfotelmatobacter sp.]|nr:AMP-binding protein [Candidatus Sulfotelmatobacter sp.]